jgi:thioredoxin-related protein
MIASGYLEEQKLEPILIFILENAGRNASYDEFREQFEKTYYDSITIKRQKEITWLSPVDAFTKQAPLKKKTLVFINSNWCNTCKVMKSTSFIDSTLEKYLLEQFSLVEFNPEITDTITFKGQKFYNTQDPKLPFHQLAIALGKNSISFPSLIILNEKQEVLDVITSYVSPRFLYDILHYYGGDIYKNKSWQDYIKDRQEKKAG